MSCMYIFKRIKDLFFNEEWELAYREADNSDDVLFNRTKAFNAVKQSWRYWLADPFIAEDEDITYIFFEMFDKLKNKGSIGYSKITDNYVSAPQIILTEKWHLSYPFIFKMEDKWFMLPEANESKSLLLYETESFPVGWKRVKEEFENVLYCDTTLFIHNNIEWLFTLDWSEEIDLNSKLLLFYREIGNNDWKEHKGNPIIYNSEVARPAGNLFYNNGLIIRPSQDCKKSYGDAINFNVINEINTEKYSEETLLKISTNDLEIDSKRNYCGIHTYNKSSKYEVIDLKYKRLNLLSALSRTIKSISRRIKGISNA